MTTPDREIILKNWIFKACIIFEICLKNLTSLSLQGGRGCITFYFDGDVMQPRLIDSSKPCQLFFLIFQKNRHSKISKDFLRGEPIIPRPSLSWKRGGGEENTWCITTFLCNVIRCLSQIDSRFYMSLSHVAPVIKLE